MNNSFKDFKEIAQKRNGSIVPCVADIDDT